jgi:hypothetical protein
MAHDQDVSEKKICKELDGCSTRKMAVNCQEPKKSLKFKRMPLETQRSHYLHQRSASPDASVRVRTAADPTDADQGNLTVRQPVRANVQCADWVHQCDEGRLPLESIDAPLLESFHSNFVDSTLRYRKCRCSAVPVKVAQ